MKKRGVSDNSPVKQFIGGVYKVIGFWFGELKARVRNESQGERHLSKRRRDNTIDRRRDNGGGGI